MKNIVDVRQICGHYYYQEKYLTHRLFSEHRCLYIGMNSCVSCFKQCPLYELVKRPKKDI